MTMFLFKLTQIKETNSDELFFFLFCSIVAEKKIENSKQWHNIEKQRNKKKIESV